MKGQDLFDDSTYESDEFRMYGFKIKSCSIKRSHDWTLCPFAHSGERARRRDPRKFNYAAIACPEFRNGDCKKGENCQFAHGVFEYWLHPGKYRTRECNAGRFCERKVCFFAHSPEQLRAETKYKWHCACNSGNKGGSNGGGAATPALKPVPVRINASAFEAKAEFLRSLNMKKADDQKPRNFGCCVSDFDFPDIKWISELVE
ncbi:hypothetical protein F0562_026448 [Nyssa sinensis]|uniref:C3H1-type domain-containing protein n=1 Tax=Nyssa sinensis TaxID=561372 RepID=A0A5J5BBG0_9ASTE|nr:hypothetical protein F0562_026448 [Nyssa sinensis]